MKKLLLVIVLIKSSFISFSQTNTYYPFNESKGMWNEYSMSQGYPSVYYSYGIFGDTLINSNKGLKVYYHLWKHSKDTFKISNSQFFGYIVDSAKRVFYYRNYPKGKFLLYDFSLEVGDSLILKFFENSGNISYQTKITNIDSVMVNNKYRKRFTTSNDTWIEGIGSPRSLFSSCMGYPTCYCIQKMVCYKNDNSLIYLNPGETSCYDFTVSNDNIDLTNEITIYPNPFSIGTTIKFPKDMKNADLYIYNLTGELVRQNNKIIGAEFFVNRESLPVGIYFVRIVECGRNIASRKILINRK